MKFSIQKTIIPIPSRLPVTAESRVERVLTIVLAVVLGIPVLLVVGAISLIVGGFVWLLEKLKKVLGLPEATASSSVINSPPQNLFNNEQFKLSIVDLDLEEEVGVNFSDWYYDTLGAYSPGVSRLLTTPEISGLHGQLVGTLCREWPDGIFLQLFEPTIRQPSAGTSWLVYLEFATLRWDKLEEVGGFYLSANYAEHGLFDGQDADGVVIQFRVEGIEDAFLPSLVV